MAKTPDPSYWGNPPETPRSKYDPTYAPYQQPIPQPEAQSYHQTAPQQEEQPYQQTAPQQEEQPYQHAAPQQEERPYRHAAPQPTQQAAQPSQETPSTQPSQATSTPEPVHPLPQNPQSKKPLVIGIIIAVVLLIILGIAGCSVVSAAFDRVHSSLDGLPSGINHHENSIEDNEAYDETASLNNAFREHFKLDDGGERDDAAISTHELDSIQDHVFHNASRKPNKEGAYSPGVYFVGVDLPAGSYWFDGSDKQLSSFFILQHSSTADDTYDVVHINEYYGHNLMDLKDGEVFILDNHASMEPLKSMDETFSDPYTSGTYRVGTDLPAGTYYLAPGKLKSDYCAYYIMSDLQYDTSSFREVDYLIEGDEPIQITLKDGEYLELYNMVMSKTPDNLVSGTQTHG